MPSKSLNVSVILPASYRGGTLRGAMNIVKMLVLGAKNSDIGLTVNFGHIDDSSIYRDEDFEELKALGVTVRPFRLEVVASKSLDTLLDRWLPTKKQMYKSDSYSIFNDGISNFEESDFWIIVSDRLSHPLPPHRKYSVVVYDYIQRYVPEIFGTDHASLGIWMHYEKYAKLARSADFVMCTTQQTRIDCINYAGVSAAKAIKFPQEFDPIEHHDGESMGKKDKTPYILWTTNSTQHKNHLNVLRGLDLFFSSNPDIQMNIHISGVYTHLFDVSSKDSLHFNDLYVVEVRAEIKRSTHLAKRLKILGNLADSAYISQLSCAEWLLHGALYDNGTFSILEAAWLGIPSISSDYPAIRECCERFALEVVLFNPNEPVALKNSLQDNLTRRNFWKNKLPARDALRAYTFSSVAPDYWNVFYENYLKSGLNHNED